MANKDNPIGLQYAGGSIEKIMGIARPMYLPSTYATSVFIGDPVIKTGTSNAAKVSKIGGTFRPGELPEVNQATAGGVFTGVVIGFMADSNQSLTYGAASTERVALVVTDPSVEFIIQGDSVGTTPSAGDVGATADFVVAAGSTATGLSGVELDTSTIGTGTGQLYIERFLGVPDNEIGAFARYVVRINQSTEVANAAGI